MRLDARSAELHPLLATASPSTVTLYREDKQALTSPVWFRVEGEAVEFVVAASDAKLAHLRRDPRCVLLIFETSPPFRGVSLRSEATLLPDVGARARLAIATKYLGVDAGRAYANRDRRPAGWIVRLPMSEARAWSLADTLPRVGET